MTQEQRADFLAQFDLDAFVEHDGVAYRIDPEWLFGCHRTDASDKWFRCFAISSVRNRLHPTLSRSLCLDLCAAVLKTTVAELENAMDDVAYHIYCMEGADMDAVHTWPKAS